MDSPTPANDRPDAPAPRAFVTTRWSVVLDVGNPDTGRSHDALEQLCRAYWFPLYAYVRRRGFAPHDAQDLTQEFFARLIEKNWVVQADRSRGRFRSFLLMAMSRFLSNCRQMNKAKKRGGDQIHVPIPMDTAETRYAREPANTTTPEQAFEKQWALTLLETVLNRLRREFESSGRHEQFDALKSCLMGSRETQPYAGLTTRLGITEGAVKVVVHRMRERYRALLREEIAHTVASDADVEGELKHLFRVLARG